MLGQQPLRFEEYTRHYEEHKGDYEMIRQRLDQCCSKGHGDYKVDNINIHQR